MEHIFFNFDGDFESVVGVVFNAIGLGNASIGDSANVLGGSYAESRVLGLRVRLELNSYDHEDEFRFMITVKHDIGSGLKVREDDIKLFAKAVADLLFDNTGVVVGMEVQDKVEIVCQPDV